jgi:hypothetical protein
MHTKWASEASRSVIGWTEVALWNISPRCRFNFVQGDLVSFCCHRKVCRTYCVCHLQGHWVKWGCVLLEHWNVLYNYSASVCAPVVIMTSVSTPSLPSCYSTLAVCCSPSCHCCSSDTYLSCSNLTFLFVISPSLLLSMALKYLLIMENFSSFWWGACVNFTFDFDKRPVYKLWLGLWDWKWNQLQIKCDLCSSCSVFVPW